VRRSLGWLSAGFAVGLVAAAPAAGDFSGSSGPDDSIAQAYGPLRSATDVFGGFRSADDVDYASFVVPRDGERLHFDVENTVGRCTSPYANGCPVYATLLDGSAQQLGGEGSSAGTGSVDAGAVDVIDWSFARAGTYYVAVDSDGDSPTYRVRHAEVAAPAPEGGGTAGESSPPPSSDPTSGAGSTTGAGADPGPVAAGGSSSTVRRLTVRSPQHGKAVTASVRVEGPLRKLRLTLRPVDGGPVLGLRRMVGVSGGPLGLRVALRHDGVRRLARRGHLRLRLTLAAVPEAGPPVTLAQRVTLVASRR